MKLQLTFLVLILSTFSLFAQKTITGTILLEDDGEAIGASIVIDGDETVGTVSEFDGTFVLEVPEETKYLKISYTGFTTQVVSIEAISSITVTLLQDENALTHYHGYGYYVPKKREPIPNPSTTERIITGTIFLAEEGEAIGANVVVDGDENLGTVTEFDGTFVLHVPKKAKALKISYTGFTTQIVSIEEISNITVTLEGGGFICCSGCWYVHYPAVKPNSLSTGISYIREVEEISLIPITSIDHQLQGKSTGLHATAQNGKPGANAFLRIRGNNSISNRINSSSREKQAFSAY